MPEEMKTVAKPAGGVTSEAKLFSAIGYIIGVLVPLFILLTDKKKNKFMQFHAYQSLLFTVVWIVYSVVFMVVVGVLAAVLGPLAFLVTPLNFLPWIVAIFLAYKAYTGEKFMLPVVGGIAAGQVK